MSDGLIVVRSYEEEAVGSRGSCCGGGLTYYFIFFLYCNVRVVLFVLQLYLYCLSTQLYGSCGVFLLYCCVISGLLDLCSMVDGIAVSQPHICFSGNQTKVILHTFADGLRVTSEPSLS